MTADRQHLCMAVLCRGTTCVLLYVCVICILCCVEMYVTVQMVRTFLDLLILLLSLLMFLTEECRRSLQLRATQL